MIAKRVEAMKQLGLGLNLSTKKTRKREFLEEMERVVPWSVLLKIVAPHYPKARTGRPPFGIETMLRIHYLQQWFGLSDPAMEEALHDVPLFREFAKLDGVMARLPDETTILRFRHLLEKHELAADMLRVVNDLLQHKGLMMRTGTAVDATLISAPSSTKNADGERDPEMKQTKKGNNWCVSRTQAADLWCCTEDGSRPPEAGLQEQASNHPVLLRSKGAAVSDRAKVIPSGAAGTY
jgi:IS5 family transposase